MLKKIRIRNFKSIEDVTLDLEQVNLLIGPNNSGKTNLLQAIKFFSHYYYGKETFNDKFDDFCNRNSKEKAKEIDLIFKQGEKYLHCYYKLFDYKKGTEYPRYKAISLMTKEKEFIDWGQLNDFSSIQSKVLRDQYCVLQFSDEPYNLNDAIPNKHGIANETNFVGLTIQPSPLASHKYRESKNVYPFPSQLSVDSQSEIHELFKNVRIYRPDVNKIKKPQPLIQNDYAVNSDASNLASFMDSMQSEEPEIKELIEKDLQKFVKDFKRILIPTVKVKGKQETHKKIGLLNREGQKFYSDELSDGVLYFLSLLAIVHQPDPPKLLLLEEPESFIHPRRITEVIDLLFGLAEDKGIQVIMTTHSPYVVDEFSDIPESVHVVEMEDGMTKVKNLQNIINENNKLSKKKGLPEIDYTKSLGEHWSMGFLGGIPNE